MATNSSISFGFKLKGSFWDPGYDVNNPFEANTPDAQEFDEHGYWLTAGTSDGRQGVPSKKLLLVPVYQRDYQEGYEAGSWFRKVNHQG